MKVNPNTDKVPALFLKDLDKYRIWLKIAVVICLIHSFCLSLDSLAMLPLTNYRISVFDQVANLLTLYIYTRAIMRFKSPRKILLTFPLILHLGLALSHIQYHFR